MEALYLGLASLPLTSPLATAKHTGHHVVVANHTRFSSPPPSHPPRVGYFEKTASTTTAKTAEPPSDCDWRTISTATTTTNTDLFLHSSHTLFSSSSTTRVLGNQKRAPSFLLHPRRWPRNTKAECRPFTASPFSSTVTSTTSLAGAAAPPSDCD
ncbi:hypothetical protein DEO72_LG4g2220 [Vigna unguiculata]|uniref:Uncharacterized protein n=1 Tax=Vigna unguiculata TaxID=3917 RepID=A0A4D6LRX1_VIGUN|nr:hypothetical protein DEO72_LG4g2220 [Vigna unguiculata]